MMPALRIRLPNFGVTALAVTAAIFIGFLVASELGLMLLVAVVALAAIPLSYFVSGRFSDRSGWLLIFALVTMLVANPAQQAAHVPIGYVQEVLLFGLSLGIVARLWQHAAADRTLRWLIVIWLAYLGLSLLSTVLGRSHKLPALWQLQYNLKWPLMFGLGCLLVWGDAPARQLERIVAWSWLLLLPCIALEIAAPGVHTKVFGIANDSHQNPLLGMGLRYRGPFPHSGYLAIFSALLAAICIARVIAGKHRGWLLPGLIYCALALLTGQRQELLALVVTCGLFVLIAGWRYWYLLLGLAVAIAAGLGIALVYLDHLPMQATLEQWGILDSTAGYSERAILTFKGVGVARQYFPLGAGLGTYGGAAAQKFDQSLFIELGFNRYWWFHLGLFLVDTFWPNVIAESGFFGAGLFFLLFAVMWLALFRKTIAARGTPNYLLCLMAFAALTLLLANSPTSGALTDPRSALLFWLLIGAAWRASGPNAEAPPEQRPAPRQEIARNAR